MKYCEAKYYKFRLLSSENIPVDIGEPDQKALGGCWRFLIVKNNILTIKKYYAWDGSSVPFKKRVKWIWDADKFCKRASLAHDALYQLMREGVISKRYREYADDLYYKICIKDGMPKWQAGLRLWALRKFGASALKKKLIKVYEV